MKKCGWKHFVMSLIIGIQDILFVSIFFFIVYDCFRFLFRSDISLYQMFTYVIGSIVIFIFWFLFFDHMVYLIRKKLFRSKTSKLKNTPEAEERIKRIKEQMEHSTDHLK